MMNFVWYWNLDPHIVVIDIMHLSSKNSMTHSKIYWKSAESHVKRHQLKIERTPTLDNCHPIGRSIYTPTQRSTLKLHLICLTSWSLKIFSYHRLVLQVFLVLNFVCVWDDRHQIFTNNMTVSSTTNFV